MIEELQRNPLNQWAIPKLMQRHPSFRELMEEMLGSEHQNHLGNGFWVLDYMRWRNDGRYLLQPTAALDAALLKTDIGENIPARFLRAPYANQYLQFSESLSSPLTLWHPTSKSHILEGSGRSCSHLRADRISSPSIGCVLLTESP